MKRALNTGVPVTISDFLFMQGAYAKATYTLKPTPKTVARCYYGAKTAQAERLSPL
jgi:hypothetical protein